MRYPCQACALLFSPQVCPESRGSSWSRGLQDRVGLPSWRSRRDAGEPTSRPLPFLFLSSLASPLSSFLFPRSPSFAIRCSSPTNAHVCASTYPFRPFHWNGEGVGAVPLSVPFGSYGRLSSPLHSVLLFLSVPRSFLLLVASSSCSHDSLYEVASSACNYCWCILSASQFASFYLFSRTSTLFNSISINFQWLLNLTNVFYVSFYLENVFESSLGYS